MKSQIKNQIVTAIAGILLFTCAVPKTGLAIEEKPVKTNKVLPFRKIVVKGDIEVILVQRPAVGISYTDDNEGNVKVMQQGEALRITGSGKTPARLFVYVNEIYRIEADENAVVKTEGSLSTQYLQVILKGNAQADIYSKSKELYTAIYDQAALHLRGNTDAHYLLIDQAPKLVLDNFAALRTQNTD